MKFDKTNYKSTAGSGIASTLRNEDGRSEYPLIATDDIAYDDNTRLDEYLEGLNTKVETVEQAVKDTIPEKDSVEEWIAQGKNKINIYVTSQNPSAMTQSLEFVKFEQAGKEYTDGTLLEFPSNFYSKDTENQLQYNTLDITLYLSNSETVYLAKMNCLCVIPFSISSNHRQVLYQALTSKTVSVLSDIRLYVQFKQEEGRTYAEFMAPILNNIYIVRKDENLDVTLTGNLIVNKTVTAKSFYEKE